MTMAMENAVGGGWWGVSGAYTEVCACVIGVMVSLSPCECVCVCVSGATQHASQFILIVSVTYICQILSYGLYFGLCCGPAVILRLPFWFLL